MFSTETLAAGINMPARTTVISALSRRNDSGHVRLTHNQLLQMAGRAGRRGYDTAGAHPRDSKVGLRNLSCGAHRVAIWQLPTNGKLRQEVCGLGITRAAVPLDGSSVLSSAAMSHGWLCGNTAAPHSAAGHCVVLHSRWEEPKIAATIIGAGPEPLQSQFATGYNMAANLLRARSLDEARAFIERSFGNYLGECAPRRFVVCRGCSDRRVRELLTCCVCIGDAVRHLWRLSISSIR